MIKPLTADAANGFFLFFPVEVPVCSLNIQSIFVSYHIGKPFRRITFFKSFPAWYSYNSRDSVGIQFPIALKAFSVCGGAYRRIGCRFSIRKHVIYRIDIKCLDYQYCIGVRYRFFPVVDTYLVLIAIGKRAYNSLHCQYSPFPVKKEE